MPNAMGRRGYARKRDENEPEIVAALEAVGATVYPIDKPVDLIVGYRKRTYLLEVKNGNQPPSWQRLTKDQKQFLAFWEGHVQVVRNAEEALASIGAEVMSTDN